MAEGISEEMGSSPVLRMLLILHSCSKTKTIKERQKNIKKLR